EALPHHAAARPAGPSPVFPRRERRDPRGRRGALRFLPGARSHGSPEGGPGRVSPYPLNRSPSMAQSSLPPDLPDLREGVPLERIREGEPLLGTVEGEPVLLLRHEEGISALGARCTHWGGPLEEGLAREGVLRCPWHHACFSVRDGARLGPPALAPLPRWSVRVEDGRARVGEPLPPSERRGEGPPPSLPDSVVIVGAGAAGLAAARTLRTEGYEGPVTLVDPDLDAPYDRPNLSKDYLAGTALE